MSAQKTVTQSVWHAAGSFAKMTRYHCETVRPCVAACVISRANLLPARVKLALRANERPSKCYLIKMDRALFKSNTIYQWRLNPAEARAWLLCSLRLGLIKDLRRHILNLLRYPIYQPMQVPPGVGIWNTAQLKLYAAIQENTAVLARCEKRTGTSTLLAALIGTMCLNTTRKLTIQFHAASAISAWSMSGKVYKFLSNLKVSLDTVHRDVLKGHNLEVYFHIVDQCDLVKRDVYILDGANCVNRSTAWSNIIPHIAAQTGRRIICYTEDFECPRFISETFARVNIP